MKKRVIGAGSETSICFPTAVKTIYLYLLWSLASTLAEPPVQGISTRLWELCVLLSISAVLPVQSHICCLFHICYQQRQITIKEWQRKNNYVWGTKQETEENQNTSGCPWGDIGFPTLLSCLLGPQRLHSQPPSSSILPLGTGPTRTGDTMGITGMTRHPNLLRVLSCCCKTSLYTSAACLPHREVRITRFAAVKEKGAKPRDLLLLSPWHWNQACGSVMPFFCAWIHEELLPLPAQLNCTTMGGLNCVFKQAPCCSVSHSFFFSFHCNFIYITF